jgi:hypothetical protein
MQLVCLDYILLRIFNSDISRYIANMIPQACDRKWFIYFMYTACREGVGRRVVFIKSLRESFKAKMTNKRVIFY